MQDKVEKKGGEWDAELEELQTRRKLAKRMGGEEAVAKFKARAEEQAKVASSRATEVQKQAYKGAEAAGSALFGGLNKAQTEIGEFVSARMRRDMAAQSKLMACRNFDEFRAVQKEFLDEAMKDYAEMGSRFMQLAGSFTPKALEQKD